MAVLAAVAGGCWRLLEAAGGCWSLLEAGAAPHSAVLVTLALFLGDQYSDLVSRCGRWSPFQTSKCGAWYRYRYPLSIRSVLGMPARPLDHSRPGLHAACCMPVLPDVSRAVSEAVSLAVLANDMACNKLLLCRQG